MHLIAPKYDFTQLLSILDRQELTSPKSLWLPMPTGATIAANAYNRPVIYISPNDCAGRTCFPFFTPVDTTQPPITIAYILNCHFISLTLELSPDCPLPYLDTEWDLLHQPIANGWKELYLPNRQLFLEQARYRKYLGDLEADQKRDPSKPPKILDLSSDDSDE